MEQWSSTSRFTLRCYWYRRRTRLSEGNGPVPQDAYVMLGGITLEELRGVMAEVVDKAFDKLTENMRRANQRLAGLEQEAPQPCLAMEANVTEGKKTRERTEGATAAIQAKHGNSCFAKRFQAGPTSSTSFGMKDESPALSRWDVVLVDKGAAAPKLCLSPVEMRTPTAAGGLLPTGKISTATMIIFHQLPLWFCLLTKEIKSSGIRNKLLGNKSSGFRNKFASPNPHVALFLQRVLAQGGLSPRTRTASHPKRVLDLGSVSRMIA